MSKSPEREGTDVLFEEAASWFLQIETGEILATDPDYAAWLAQSPAHADAMKRARIAWGSVGDKASEPEVVSLRRDALNRSSAAARSRWSPSPHGFWPRAAMVAAACLTLAIGAALVFQPWSGRQDAGPVVAEAVDRYQTVTGETRTVTLADNSRISLDASTGIEVRYTDDARDITLLEGQAHFEVAKDVVRPFRVTAGSQTVIATGTAFNVELVDEDVFVTLLEGEVIVTEDGSNSTRTLSSEAPSSDKPKPRPSTTLKPGQQLIASVEAPPVVAEAVDLEKTNAWRRGKVMLVDDPLSVAVARMNRYSQIRLVVADDSLDELGVSGVFNAGDTDAFVEALEAYFPVDARRVSASRIEIHPRN